jgi:hypothetical protein
MARYNIELRTDTHMAETIVVEREDIAELRIEMARFVGELLRDHAAQLWLDQDWRVDVTDDRRLILFVMHISVRDTAATQKLKR